MLTKTEVITTDALIIGAGPVGLFAVFVLVSKWLSKKVSRMPTGNDNSGNKTPADRDVGQRNPRIPLLTDAAGRRLAKRDGAPTIRSMRQKGMSPAEIIALTECPS